MELNDYINESKPDIMDITTTKLYESLQSMNVGENRYTIWRSNRSREKGGGMMLLVKKEQKELQVDEITYGEGCAEVLKVGVRNKGEISLWFTFHP